MMCYRKRTWVSGMSKDSSKGSMSNRGALLNFVAIINGFLCERCEGCGFLLSQNIGPLAECVNVCS